MLLSLLDPFLRDGELKQQWRIVARWSLWFGTAFAVFTALAGWYAYNTVAHDTPSHAAMTEHRNWALATLLAFLALSAWSLLDFRRGRRPGAPFIGLLLAGGLLLVSTAWHGGELVYRYGLGVMSLPQAEGEGEGEGEGEQHGHEHAEGQMHAPEAAAPTEPAVPAADKQHDSMQPDRVTEAPAAPDAEAAPPKPRAKSRKPHNADGHTH